MNTEWRTPGERESPKRWARRVRLGMTDHEFTLFCSVVDRGALEAQDHSRPARKARLNREAKSALDDRVRLPVFEQPLRKPA